MRHWEWSNCNKRGAYGNSTRLRVYLCTFELVLQRETEYTRLHRATHSQWFATHQSDETMGCTERIQSNWMESRWCGWSKATAARLSLQTQLKTFVVRSLCHLQHHGGLVWAPSVPSRKRRHRYTSRSQNRARTCPERIATTRRASKWYHTGWRVSSSMP